MRHTRSILRMLVGASLLLTASADAPATGPGLAAGRFLVAHREMTDPNFARSVVLLLEYDASGAVGLVINRPSELPLSALSSEIEGLRGRREPVYVGGPVPGPRVFVLIRSSEAPDGTTRVMDGLHVSREQQVLERLAATDGAEFRVFAGYAGWAPGQLDHEVGRGDWHVVPAAPEWIFETRPEQLWDALLPPEPSRQATVSGKPGRDPVRTRRR